MLGSFKLLLRLLQAACPWVEAPSYLSKAVRYMLKTKPTSINSLQAVQFADFLSSLYLCILRFSKIDVPCVASSMWVRSVSVGTKWRTNPDDAPCFRLMGVSMASPRTVVVPTCH